MRYIARVMMVGLLLTAACAATERIGRKEAVPPPQGVAALDRALETEKNPSAITDLLFRRGHAYLEAAEFYLKQHPAPQDRAKDFEEYGKYFLLAMQDFNQIVDSYPKSVEAPEALFHLGIIYDYPDLSKFDLALLYYQRTVKEYPGTESARKAEVNIEYLESVMKAMKGSSHEVK